MTILNKNFWFRVIAIALPFIFFIIVEVFLRIGGYGENYSLFITPEGRPDYLIMNPLVSEKYFSRKENATVGYFEAFKTKKSHGTFRVFVMGASTAVGYPYFHNGSFHRMLKYLLQRTYPEVHVEVINTSLTAVNSHTLADFAKEIVHYEPDAVLIYAGHNEYYGALGVGSTGYLGRWPWLIKLTLAMREWRISQLFINLFQKVAGGKKPVELKENLMKRMAGEQLIPYKSPIFEAGLEQYKFNLTEILRIFDRKKIPVFISNVVSNEKDQKPLVSALLERTDSTDFFLAFRQMETAFKAHRWDEAEKLGRHVKKQDSTYAKTYFVHGQAALKRGEPGKARRYFIKARQYDYLRFRAPIEINQIIMDLSQSTNASFVDVKEAFESASYEGILGEELILEHLHPNLRGYAIIAEAFYEAILKKNLVSSPMRQSLTPEVWHEYPLTEVDTLFGNYEIQVLKERWPFYEKLEIDTLNRTFPEALAGGLVVKQLTWDQAMDKLYSFYHQKKDFKNTLRVAEAVIMEHPEHAAFYAKAGSVCLRLRYFDKGAGHFQKAYDLQPSPQYARFAALCLLHQNKLEGSLKLLTKAMKDNQTNPRTMQLMGSLRKIIEMESRLKQEKANSQLLNQLAGHYFMIGLEDKARNLIGEALALEPSNIASLRLLRQMDQKQN